MMTDLLLIIAFFRRVLLSLAVSQVKYLARSEIISDAVDRKDR
jgi:hypothetical protein